MLEIANEVSLDIDELYALEASTKTTVYDKVKYHIDGGEDTRVVVSRFRQLLYVANHKNMLTTEGIEELDMFNSTQYHRDGAITYSMFKPKFHKLLSKYPDVSDLCDYIKRNVKRDKSQIMLLSKGVSKEDINIHKNLSSIMNDYISKLPSKVQYCVELQPVEKIDNVIRVLDMDELGVIDGLSEITNFNDYVYDKEVCSQLESIIRYFNETCTSLGVKPYIGTDKYSGSLGFYSMN